jgi:hypothetical protein
MDSKYDKAIHALELSGTEWTLGCFDVRVDGLNNVECEVVASISRYVHFTAYQETILCAALRSTMDMWMLQLKNTFVQELEKIISADCKAALAEEAKIREMAARNGDLRI